MLPLKKPVTTEAADIVRLATPYQPTINNEKILLGNVEFPTAPEPFSFAEWDRIYHEVIQSGSLQCSLSSFKKQFGALEKKVEEPEPTEPTPEALLMIEMVRQMFPHMVAYDLCGPWLFPPETRVELTEEDAKQDGIVQGTWYKNRFKER